ncbi:MAG: hypothetical protein RQ885_04120 [Desulfurococcales archaeon]|jgi:hypothetical protein|nr:hypothetical protein [Desulfurococcales archaeon]
MMLRAPETEALYEGNAQKGFGVLSIDGSPVPLDSTATHETTGVSKTLWGRWKSLNDHRDVITSLWIKKQSNSTKEYQRQSITIGGQAEVLYSYNW